MMATAPDEEFSQVLEAVRADPLLRPYDMTQVIDEAREARNFITSHLVKSEYLIDAPGKRLVLVAKVANSCEGPVGLMHGGFATALLDQSMGRTALVLDQLSVTGRLEIDFRKPVPLGRTIVVVGWISEDLERKLILQAELKCGETTCVQAKGIFVKVGNRAEFQ